MPDKTTTSWFKIGETQELLLCTDADLERASAPRLPTEELAVDRSFATTSQYMTIRFKPVAEPGGTTLNVKKQASSRTTAVIVAGAIVAVVSALVVCL